MYYYKRVLLLCMSLLGLAVLFSAVGGLHADNPPDYITEFPLPNTGMPHALIQTENTLWFTAPGVNAIGSLVVTTTLEYAFTFYPIPTANSEPYDLAAGNGAIWFTETAGNRLGKLDIASGSITEYAIPTANSAPAGIDVAANGTVWFVQRSGNNLSKFDPAQAMFTEYAYPFANAALEDVAVTNAGGEVWMTAANAHYLSSFTIATAAFYHAATIAFGAPPYTPTQVVIDNAGNPWVSTRDGVIGRYSPSTIQLFRWYRVAAAGIELDGLIWQAQGTHNQLWFTEANTGYAGQLLVKNNGSTISKWHMPITIGHALYGIVQDEDGTIWIANSGQHTIIRWEAPYLLTVYLPVVMN